MFYFKDNLDGSGKTHKQKNPHAGGFFVLKAGLEPARTLLSTGF